MSSWRQLKLFSDRLLEEATQQGRQAERRATIENLLLVRFGSLDDTLSAIIPQLLELPPEEFTRELLQLSREALLAKFGRPTL